MREGVQDTNMEGQTPRNGGAAGAGEGTPAGFIPLSSLLAAPSIGDEVTGRQPTSLRYWRSLDELEESPEFQRMAEREFPFEAPRDMAALSRREFMRLMGGSLALAGLASGCAYQPPENIVPYVEQPEQIIPGKPLYFTTAFQRDGYAYGVLAESHMGRPVKLEGNPDHPSSLGATDAFTQASLLTLYDPDRSQSVRLYGSATTWETFLGAVDERLPALRRNGGAGLRILTETITSPTLSDQLRRLLARFPAARLVHHDPVGRENVRAGARLAFGQEVNPVYRFDRAERVFSLDSNFMLEEPGSVRYARDFVVGGRVARQGQQQRMNRLYVVESTPTITGAYADHRLPLRPSQVEALARVVAAGVGGGAAAGSATLPAGVPQTWVDALVKDLQEHRGTSLVIAGLHQPPAVHALAHVMNQALGNIGQTVSFTAPAEVHFGPREGTLRELVDDLNGGRVEMLLILGSNPVYTAPADLQFRQALQGQGGQRAPLRIHLGLYDDETAALCEWHIPESHYLESWSDARAHDGTVSIVQPLIQPLYASRSAHELLAVLLGEGDITGYDIIRSHWMRQQGVPASRTAPGSSVAGSGTLEEPAQGTPQLAAFEKFWHRALTSGTIPGTALPARPVTAAATSIPSSSAAGGEGMEMVFRPDPTLWDGRYTNNAWLQELPKPLTQLTWDNAALISPATARAQNLRSKDRVRLTRGNSSVDAAVLVLPGQPDDTVAVYLGHGRTRAGRVGNGTGFNAYALRTAESPGFGSGVQLSKIGGGYKLAVAQHHFSVEGRDLIRVGTFDQLTANPANPAFMHVGEHHGTPGSLLPPQWPSDRKPPAEAEHEAPAEGAAGAAAPPAEAPEYEGTGYNGNPIPAWGMVIDTNACIGCNACVLACQAENNIATVGKDEVARNRELHWIRIDTYFSGPEANPETIFEPVPCMHCEKAPCEPVCPVEATSHSAEGINEQTYNRCVGTRYCENNCPYKVRRFNYLQYSDQKTPSIQMMRNPDVTVRSRGVMEKCTYCVQRINQARIEAQKEGRPIREGDVLTACQQVCPTQAIVFGNINDTQSHGGQGSKVRQLKTDPLNFALLTELNTKPRTSYLAKLRNPNPALGGSAPQGPAEAH